MVTPIEQAYIDLHPKSAEYYATSKDLFPNGVTHDARNLKPFPYFVDPRAGLAEVGRGRQRDRRLQGRPRGADPRPQPPGHRDGGHGADD